MKRLTLLLLTLVNIYASGQENLTEQAQPIVAEGKRLYKSEMASWYGTDVFLEKYTNRANVGGYFSYLENDMAKCVFFSKADKPKVIGTISFDSTYNVNTAKTDLAERDFTTHESDLYTIRKAATTTINTDTIFKVYENTSLNLIPLINGKEKKVYVLTGSKQHGSVIFGNDYLLTFNNDNTLKSRKQLHRNIITIQYGEEEEGKKIETTMHTHLPETGDFITATDICTLMLYEKFTTWKQHNVISKNYMNIWNCQTNELFVISMKVINKINKDQETRKNRKGK